MYIGYVDESGFVGRNRNPNQPVQVMACIMSNTYTLHRTLNEFDHNLRILRENNIPLAELKAEEIYRGRGAWQSVDGHVRHEIFTRYLDWLVNRRHFIILSLIDNNKFFDLKMSHDELAQTLEYPYIAGAMHIALAAQRANQRLSKNKGKTLLIFDEQPQFKQSVETLIAQPPGFTDYYYGFRRKDKTKLNQIIDTAYFVKSDYSYLIQIADTVAFISRHYLQLTCYGLGESYRNEKTRINGWLSSIKGRLIPRRHMCPRDANPICTFFKNVAPDVLPF